MSLVRRCLLHAPGTDRFHDLAREIVAAGAEVMAVGETADRLTRAGIPVDNPASGRAADETFHLLHPRLLQGILGDWEQPEGRSALERQGVKRIDMLVAELPAEVEDPGRNGARASVEALTILRAAAWVPQQVLVVSDPADVPTVIELLGAADPGALERLRWRMAGKALVAISRLDAARAGRTATAGGLPSAWSLQVDVLDSLPLIGERTAAVGLYEVARSLGGAPALQLVCGEPLTAAGLQAAGLAWTAVEDGPRASAALAHRTGLVGYAAPRQGPLAAAFEAARALDPRGAFGAVAAFNREVDDAAGRSVADAFLEAVVAPAFSPDALARARRQRLRLLQVRRSPRPALQVTGTRWGLVLEWSPAAPEGVCRTLTARTLEATELEALERAWRLLQALPPGAALVCDGERLLGAAGAQASAREAIRLALAGTSARGAVAALSLPLRMVEDLQTLAEAGVSAVRQPEGSPRMEEILARAAQVGVAVQVVAGPPAAGGPRGET